MKKILVRHTSILINDYDLGDNKQLEHKLSVWDNVFFKSTPYYTYDEDKRQLRIPRGIGVNMLEVQFNAPAHRDYEHDEFDKVSFKLKAMPKDDIQRKSVCFLIGAGEFENTSGHSQVSLNLTTGDGKTYCCIAAMTELSMKTIIITHQEKIKTQWLESLVKFTTLDEDMICNIDSSRKLDKLMKDKNKYKVFLVNHATIRSYAKTHGWEYITEVFSKLKIGLKIYDEAHLEFANMIKIDQFTNTKKNFYITANFNKSSANEDYVFNNAFANVMRFGQETLVDKYRHILYMSYLYNSHPDMMAKASIKNKKGFNRNAYADYQMTKDYQFDISVNLIRKFLVNNTTKVLILFSKIDTIDAFMKIATKEFPDKRVGSIHSKLTPEERANSDECDIIISTPMSVGTGTDIANLGCLIMTEPYSSTNTANQVSGRLRYLGNQQTSYYIELVDIGFTQVHKMYQNRLKFLKKKCKEVVVIRDK